MLLWWAALLVNSLLQLKWFFTVKENLPTLNGAQRKRFLCAAAYLIGSTVRALYPVNWEVLGHFPDTSRTLPRHFPRHFPDTS